MNSLNTTLTAAMTATPHPQDMVQIDQTALARLRAKAALAEIPTWKPEAGAPPLEGILFGSREVEGPFGPQHQALVQTVEGALIGIWLNPWLLGELRGQSAELGDLVSLSFLGKGTSARGTTFNKMSLTILKP
jgi:hypothetical protein